MLGLLQSLNVLGFYLIQLLTRIAAANRSDTWRQLRYGALIVAAAIAK